MQILFLLALGLQLLSVPPVMSTQEASSAWVNDIGSMAASYASDQQAPSVCFIVRTFWGHGDDYGDKSIRTMLSAIKAQHFTRWEALLLVLDNRPFPELRRIVRDYEDDRIWVYAEWVNHKYEPKKVGEGGKKNWAPGYHNKLYNLTDAAIRACPPTTEWVVVTNGDNNYDPAFLDYVVSAPPNADAVAVDFYSRYQRPTAHQCQRFAKGPGLPQCKENEMRFCQTDLAATAYRWRRLVEEDWRFGAMDPDGDSGANDGMMAQHMVVAGWKVHRVRRCLADHGPSPQQCALLGNVWDDSGMSTDGSFGGECLRRDVAQHRIAESPSTLQVMKLSVSYDPDSFGFQGLHGKPLVLACIQSTEPEDWVQAQVFGRACCARLDMKDFPTDLPPHPWDSWADTDLMGSLGAEI